MRNAVGYSVQSPDSVFIFRSQESFSALVIKSQYQGKYYLYLDDDLTPIPRDEDIDEPTYFISLPTPGK